MCSSDLDERRALELSQFGAHERHDLVELRRALRLVLARSGEPARRDGRLGLARRGGVALRLRLLVLDLGRQLPHLLLEVLDDMYFAKPSGELAPPAAFFFGVDLPLAGAARFRFALPLDAFDADSSGTIDLDELQAALAKGGAPSQAASFWAAAGGCPPAPPLPSRCSLARSG